MSNFVKNVVALAGMPRDLPWYRTHDEVEWHALACRAVDGILNRRLEYGSVSDVSLVGLPLLQFLFDDGRWMSNCEFEHWHRQREQNAVLAGWHNLEMFGWPQQYRVAV